MSDIIHLLPDSVANQIAAGEVIQRPASAVKELLENAIDAGSTTIQLVIKDAGRTLIQVIDDGIGMSATDARLSFERHATSKIKSADDLFNLNTKGFRGEALASIAAIAQVELKTKRENDELGTLIRIEGSEVKEQEPCSCTKGTSFSVKNLFFNVPARRNFLKSNAIEIKHIIDEFQRVALVHPEIAFSMYNNGNEVFNLNKGSFRQRIVGVFGDKYNQKLVP
ncbi:MAG: ATP-binding protein, partial [Flavobacteriales bacterium]|nr:ATP-binding protein [Flavobacteriales bacterium]